MLNKSLINEFSPVSPFDLFLKLVKSVSGLVGLARNSEAAVAICSWYL